MRPFYGARRGAKAERRGPSWIEVLHVMNCRATLLSMAGVQSLPDTFTTATALARGLHPRALYALRDSGDVVELSRGVFRRADAPLASEPDLLAVAYRSAAAIVCCRSAAAIHELSDELPPAVQIAVPTGHRPPRITYPPTEVLRFAADTFEVGLSRLEAAPGEWVRIYTPARTVIDLMRLRHRFGESLAFAALQRYLRRRDATPAELLRLASMFDVAGPVR
ncbi:MAG: type IV toxin-antitoxin system AbiEi family antitoxin domain-containing protein, partial [Gemmatimonadaceae bacterium]